MGSRKSKPERSLGRDPFEGMDWPPDSEPEPQSVGKVLVRDPFHDMEWEPEPEREPGRQDSPQAEPVQEAKQPQEPEADPQAEPEAEPQAEPEAEPQEDSKAAAEPKVQATPTPRAQTAPVPVAIRGVSEEEINRRLQAAERSAPGIRLKGKGVWLDYSGDVERALKVGLTIGATHIIYKTGQHGMFFVEGAQRIYERVRRAGLTPMAWSFLDSEDPIAIAGVVVKSMEVGYEGFVFQVGDEVAGRELLIKTLGWQVLAAGLKPAQLYYATFPNIWQHPDIPYREFNRFCRGGYMPWCAPSFQRTARTVIDKWAYGEYERWSQEWRNMPPMYPVLSASRDERAGDWLNAQEFLEWAQTLDAHAPSFFSVYRARTTGPELWPILAAMGEPPVVPVPELETAPAEEQVALQTEVYAPEPEPEPEADVQPTPTPPPPAEPAPPSPEPAQVAPEEPPAEEKSPQPVYYVATIDDTVWGICRRHDITQAQFWQWNGYLWDEMGMPRDTLYLQEGWRLRVG